MGNAVRTYGIRIAVLDGGKATAELVEFGEKGEKAVKKVVVAGTPASMGLNALSAAANDVKGAAVGMASQLGPVGAGLAALGPYGLAAAAAMTAVTLGLKAAYSEAAKAEQSFNQLQAIVSATGHASGLTAREISAFADEMEANTLVTAEEVQDAAGVLTTFGSVSGDVFKDTIIAAQNMSTVWKTDLTSAVMKVAKALDDPIDGLTALKKAGAKFNEEERDMIRNLVESGEKAEAQGIILDKLKGKIEGTGGAAAQGLTGATNRLSDAWGNFWESVGQTSVVSNATTGFITRLSQAFEGLRGAIEGPAPVDSAAEIAEARMGAKIREADNRAEQLYEQRKKLDESLDKLISDPGDKVAKANKELEQMRTQLNKLRNEDGSNKGDVDAAVAQAEKVAKLQIEAIRKPAVDAATRAAESNQKVIDDLMRGIAGVSDKRQAFINDALSKLTKDAPAAIKADTQRLAGQLFDQNEAEEKLKKLKEEGEAVTKATVGATAAYTAELQKLKELLDAGAISQDTYNTAVANAGREQLKSRKDAEAGALRAFARYQDEAEDSASAVEAAFTKGMKATEDVITDAVLTGGQSLSSLGDLANSVVADITRSIVQQSITGPLFKAIGGSMESGGMLDGILSSIFHEGGIAGGSAPQRRVPAFVFAGAPRYHGGGIAGLKPGEVPAILERGERVIPNGGSSGSPVNIVMNIQTPDAGSFRASQKQISAEAARSLDRARRNL